MQALQVSDPNVPFMLTVSVDDYGFGWGLWQKQEEQKHPVGFSRSCGKKPRFFWFPLVEK